MRGSELGARSSRVRLLYVKIRVVAASMAYSVCVKDIREKCAEGLARYGV